MNLTFISAGTLAGEISDIGGAIGDLPDSAQFDLEINIDDYSNVFDDFTTEIDTSHAGDRRLVRRSPRAAYAI